MSLRLRLLLLILAIGFIAHRLVRSGYRIKP